MPLSTDKREEIKEEILCNIHYDWKNITAKMSEKFSLSKQTINKYLQELVREGYIEGKGNGRTKKYRYKFEVINKEYINDKLYEDIVWKEIWKKISHSTIHINDDAKHILEYGFTEIFNNAIDHSESKKITVTVFASKYKTLVFILDQGIGIFEKIYKSFNLKTIDEAIFELAKGKLTSDPKNHTGEGIFFTSRAMDEFQIYSSGLCFCHNNRLKKDYLLQVEGKEGTMVCMSIQNNTNKKLKEVFDEFSGPNDGFTKTVIPIMLAQIEGSTLISRSQAKRIMARCEKFKEVILDFEGVTAIGQGFADQIFRVFSNEHPEIEISVINANEEVSRMISHAYNTN